MPRNPVILLAGLVSCAHSNPPAPAAAPTEAPVVPSTPPPRFDPEPKAEGLGFTLSEVGAPDGGVEAVPSAATTPLSAADLTRLLARAPALEAPASDRQPFAVRERSLPPPRKGETVLGAFPAASDVAPPVVVDTGPLTVLRRSPEGEVPVAPNLSITFSRPMVAVGTQAQTAAQVPVKLTPAVPGEWRWLGTKTLMFQPTGRFPAATEYTAEIPAGTRSADGQAIDAVKWTFATPPASIEQASRGSVATTTLPKGKRARNGDMDPQGLQPVFGLVFDQRVDPARIAAALRLTGDLPVRLATDAEIAADPAASALTKDADLAGRVLAVVPAAPLAKDTTYTLVLPKGAPSAEGPRPTTADQAVSFRTYAPLRLERTYCDWGGQCPPSSGWSVQFDNPLDDAAFDPATVTVEPAVPGWSPTVYGNTLHLAGTFTGRTTYTVQIPAALKDRFGQTLGKDATVRLDVGPAERTLVGPSSPFVVADPAGGAQVSFFTTNSKGLKTRINAVTPAEWDDWVEWNQKYRWEDAKRPTLPGRTVKSGVVNVENRPEAMVETRLDLAPYLSNGTGMFLVQVEPVEPPRDRWSRQEWIGWVQVTNLGVTAFSDRENLVVWANDLATGKPVEGAEVSLLGDKSTARTGADGLAAVQLGSTPGIVVKKGGDTALLVTDPYGYGNGWDPGNMDDQAAWYVFDEKHLYKPGETVHVHGWLRRSTVGPKGDIAALRDANVTVAWTLTSAMGNPLGQGTARLSRLGGFSLEVALPKTPDLGQARLQLTAQGAEVASPYYTHEIDIEEYRTPEFEVSTDAGAGPWELGGDATVDVDAHYYAGGALPGADVTWRVTAAPGTYVPPGREEWSFGPWSPWWWQWENPTGTTTSHELAGKTDASGQHHLGIHFDTMKPARPYTVHAEATVMDVNRQAWTSSRDLLVHPSDLYVGLKTARPWAEKGQPVRVEALVVDRDGLVADGAPVAVKLARLEWKKTAGNWAQAEVEPVDCALTSTREAQACTFTPTAGGEYVVRGTVKDRFGRPNESELRLWVSGADAAPDRGVEQERVTLLPEKRAYAPGETATFGVQAPFWPAEGVLTVRRDGLVETRGFRMESASTTLAVPITEAMLPDVTIQVDLVGQQKRSSDAGIVDGNLAPRVAYATGTLTFDVSKASRALSVAVTPGAKELEPAGKTNIRVAVTDAKGQAVPNAELAVVAVDEAVLALSGYELPDPLSVFYAARGAGVSDAHLRQWVNLTTPTQLGGLGATGTGPGGGGVAGGVVEGALGGERFEEEQREAPVARRATLSLAKAAPPMAAMDAAAAAPTVPQQPTTPIAMRSDFRALALWAPDVTTDAQGVATVPLALPDSLTRYRIMVVAVAKENLFGSGQADVTARLPLMVRPSAPRFLNFGDKLELPVVLQNQTDQPMVVDVALRAANLAVGTAPDNAVGRRLTVPAKDRVEVRFPASADQAGTARAQVVVASGTFADAASIELPVWTPATTEAFATYGVVDGAGSAAVRQPIATPTDVWPQFGGLSVTTSSTNLQALTDAFLYLVHYPYDCNEQRAARILGIAGLRDILTAFDAPGVPSKEALEASVASDLETLEQRQNPDGGWAFWRRNDPSWPYLSIEVAHALVRAESKGYAVAPNMKARSLAYVGNIERHIPSWYSQEAKWLLRAYALYVQDLSGKPDVAKAKRLLTEATVDRLPIEAQGYLLPTLKGQKEADTIRAFLANRVAESAAGAHFVTNISDGAHVLLESDRRADGVLLEAFVRTDPKNDLIPKLVEGLLAHRRKGAWANTTENAAILLAMDRYFAAYESVTPDFVARAWLGDAALEEHTFSGHTTERARTDVPMDWLTNHAAQDLVLQKDGAGRMYYRVGLDYAPKSLHLDAADYGFTVVREYAAVDDPGDVRRDADGTWHVKAGARVRVKLQMVAPMRRYHVALVDPLPAGFEVINPALATSGSIPQEAPTAQKGWWWWWRTWYEHENLRDDRVEAFTSLLWEGVYDYSYVARATTPGTFVVPPSKAEEMYTPETFGRAASDRVVIE